MIRKWLVLSLMLVGNLTVYAPNLPETFIEEYNERNLILAQKQYEYEVNIRLLLKTIRIIETRENYTLDGKSKEYGAYQFTPKTWENSCKQIYGEVLDITIPENQYKVARKKLELLLSKGYNDSEIASIWNSGSPNWKGKVGVNKFGVKYNTPEYVVEFLTIKNELNGTI